jgi:arabinose-5-phosphate isomerase
MTPLTRCLQKEAPAIAAAVTPLDAEELEAALTLPVKYRARLANLGITGMGNSIIMVRKIALTSFLHRTHIHLSQSR